MIKDFLLMMGPIAVASGGPYLALMVDDKLGITPALYSVSRVAKALHMMTFVILGMIAGLCLGYFVGSHS